MDKTPSFIVQAFGNYILLDRIAVGGMAEIFKAKQSGARGFEKIVVIKKILQHLGEDPEFVSMFEDEAKIAAQLNQANIVQIYELGEVNDVLYIVMEYVEGKNLRDLNRALQSKNLHLSIEQAIFIMSEVLKGLDYAHRKKDSMGNPLQIIHRDMSPQNIVISYEGEVKILDFGIAKAASKVTKTEAGVLKGKFSYMSPEQASGRPIDQTTDIYASGVIFHEMLSSERLFRAETDMETLERVKRGVVPAPSEKNPLVPKDLDRIVLRALARDNEKRYQTPGEFLSDLSKFSTEHHMAYSSQELASFMKTIFAETISHERSKLQKALSEVPAQDISTNKNVKTHIAFKAESIEVGPKTPENADNEITQTTFNGSSSNPTFFRFAIVAFFLFALISFLWTKTFEFPSTPAVDEAPVVDEEAHNTEEPSTETDMGADQPLPPNKITEPEVKVQPETLPLPKPPEEEVKIENILEGIEPPQIPSSSDAKNKAIENKKINYAIIDVIAPFEGYAQLYVNDQAFGTVPGPRARGIRLEAGTHRIRCQTPDRTYKGVIQLKPNDRLSVRCQELTEE